MCAQPLEFTFTAYVASIMIEGLKVPGAFPVLTTLLVLYYTVCTKYTPIIHFDV